MKYRFGEMVLDLEASRLLGPEGEVRLRPQAFRMLEVLAESAPKVLSQEELLDRVWGVEHLSPASVKQAISEVRQALGDDPGKPRIIETVHRRGYRFIAPLEKIEPEPLLPAPPPERNPELATRPLARSGVLAKVEARRTAESAGAGRPSRTLLIAVLVPLLAGAAVLALLARSLPQVPTPATSPAVSAAKPGPVRPTIAILGFRNLSSGPRAGWISGAVSEILAFELAAPGRLRVVPGDNVARMRRELAITEGGASPASLDRIGRNLGTDLVVLGSYLLTEGRDGEKLRLQILVQDVRTGETVAWARETGPPEQLLDLAAGAARGILGTLTAGSPASATPAAAATLASNLEALRLYSQALDRLRVQDAPAALQLLKRSAELDSRNPFVHDALAAAHARLGFDEKARQAAQRAVQLSEGAPRELSLGIEARASEIAGAWEEAAAKWTALWVLHPDDLEHGLSLAAALRKAGRTSDSLATIEALRKLPAPAREDPRIDLAEGDTVWQLGDFTRSHASGTRALASAEKRGATVLVAAARLMRCWAAVRLGATDEALADARTARGLLQKTGDRAGAAGAWVAEATVLQKTGRTAEARRAYEQAIQVFRETGNRSREAKALNNFAVLLNDEGDFAGVIPLLERSLQLKREMGDLQGSATTLVNLGIAFETRGQIAQARPRMEEAISISRRLEDAHGIALALRGVARLHLAEGRLAEARAALEEASGLSRQIGDGEGTAQAWLSLGHLERKAGRPVRARERYSAAQQEFARIDQPSDAAYVTIFLGELDLEEGHPDRARATFDRVLAQAHRLESAFLQANAHLGLAETAVKAGDPDRARGEYEKALVLWEKLKDPRGTERARKALAELGPAPGARS